jgi:hypothetical protein
MTLARPIPPVDPTRRHFLSQAAGVAAGGAVLALATIPPAPVLAAPAGLPDAVFSLIGAHRMAQAAHLIAIEEQNRLERLGDPDADWVTERPCHADVDTFHDLIETAPTTFAGLQAWAAYLGEIRQCQPWMVEEEAPALIVTLVEALGNLAVSS